MAHKKYINIDFPFKDSPDGFFINLNWDDNRAIKADLLHLLLTKKGQRFYNPDFGTDLINFIFEPNDSKNLSNITDSVSASIKKYLPNLTLNNLSVNPSDESEYAAVIRVDYTVSDNVFDINDFVIVKI